MHAKLLLFFFFRGKGSNLAGQDILLKIISTHGDIHRSISKVGRGRGIPEKKESLGVACIRKYLYDHTQFLIIILPS